MKDEHPPIYIFHSHNEADAAVRALGKADFNLKNLSVIGKGYHTEEHPVGFYTAGDRIKAWGGAGAFWGSIWGLLFAPAVFFLPGVGLVAMAGPVVAALVAALEGAMIVGGVSALGAALAQIGVPKNQILKYETALKADKYVLMVQGTPEELAKAHVALAAFAMAEAA